MRTEDKKCTVVTPKEMCYTHPATGLVVKDKIMYEAIMHAYNSILNEKARQERYEVDKKAKEAKDKIYNEKRKKYVLLQRELEPINKEWKDYLKLKDSYKNDAHKIAVTSIESNATTIKKLQLANKLLSSQLRAFKSDSGKEYEKKFPFKLASKKKSIMAKMSRIKW